MMGTVEEVRDTRKLVAVPVRRKCGRLMVSGGSESESLNMWETRGGERKFCSQESVNLSSE
jgi:hypothetical protein